ncbi:ead/Ea22-like family protein [Shewanella sp. T24-MNA-CIBAN-0130]|uniref:ead/Ea22-like family protein n=1 Tax=Shewanella sp. T24-MNA-CIBAN-0130 TaxID=3140470 RepID=UPI003318088F
MNNVPAFLLEMSKQMHEQNNRCTAEPVWQVRCKRWRITMSGYSDTFEFVDRENEHSVAATNKNDAEINQQIIDYLDCDPDDLPEMLETWVDGEIDEDLSGEDKINYFLEHFDHEYSELEGFELFWMEEYEDVVKGAFLTEADANWFIQRKQHDYPKLYTYVESMYHCPQMIELRNWIMSLTKAEVAA